MTFDEYQKIAHKTAVYPVIFIEGPNSDVSTGSTSDKVYVHDVIETPYVYPALGLAGEAGEVNEKIKKLMRNNYGKYSSQELDSILYELGDVLWYLAEICTTFGVSFQEVAQMNMDKLKDRQERGVLDSKGDNR